MSEATQITKAPRWKLVGVLLLVLSCAVTGWLMAQAAPAVDRALANLGVLLDDAAAVLVPHDTNPLDD